MGAKLTREEKGRAAAAIGQIAAENHTTVEDVRRSLKELIDAALADPDPTVQAWWATCPREGERPTPEEFLIWTANMVADEL